MKKLFKLIALIPCFLLLSSCSSDFVFAKKEYRFNDSALYIGCHSSIKISTGEELDNILYLDFYTSAQASNEDRGTLYDKAINLNQASLVNLDQDMTDSDGNILKFYNASNILINYMGNYTDLTSYLDDGNFLEVFFSYGSLDSDFKLITGRTKITKAGSYYFGTVEEESALPVYSYGAIYDTVYLVYNFLTGKYEEQEI